MDWSAFVNPIVGNIVNFIYFAIIAGTIIVVVLDNRNPVKTIAWILVLTFLPFIGLVFYIFFGRNIHRERILNKKSRKRLMRKSVQESLPQASFNGTPGQDELIQLFRNTNEALLFDGNRIETYTSGRDETIALIRELYQARSHIHLEYYIFEDDAAGRLIRDVLMDKAKEGVTVRVLYDDVGCWHVPKQFYEEMKEAGIEVRSFLKVRFPQFTSKVNYRNHRKLTIIDGTTGFTGGMNIAERYVKGFAWGIWRDTQIMIKGKAVYGLQTTFLTDWYMMDQTLITSNSYFPNIAPQGNAVAQIVTSDPISPWKSIMQGLALAIHNAKTYFYMQTPYFLPTEPILFAMQTAALAGVDIRLMMPQRADNRITHLASRSYLNNLLEAGVKVYFYQKGFLHSKLMVSDDCLATVGSTNMDFRSFEHNFEVNAFIYDRETALKMKGIFLQDQKDARLMTWKNWQKLPWKQKAAESIVRLLAPLL